MLTTRRTAALCITTVAMLTTACTSSGGDDTEVPGVDSASSSAPADPSTADSAPATDAPVTEIPVSEPLPTDPPPTDPPATEPAPPAPTTAPAAPTTFDPASLLRQGDTGPEVEVMQLKLITLGYLPVGSASGNFDSATNSALLDFQGQYGLIVDGIFGPESDRALTAAAQSVNVEN